MTKKWNGPLTKDQHNLSTGSDEIGDEYRYEGDKYEDVKNNDYSTDAIPDLECMHLRRKSDDHHLREQNHCATNDIEYDQLETSMLSKSIESETVNIMTKTGEEALNTDVNTSYKPAINDDDSRQRNRSTNNSIQNAFDDSFMPIATKTSANDKDSSNSPISQSIKDQWTSRTILSFQKDVSTNGNRNDNYCSTTKSEDLRRKINTDRNKTTETMHCCELVERYSYLNLEVNFNTNSNIYLCKYEASQQTTALLCCFTLRLIYELIKNSVQCTKYQHMKTEIDQCHVHETPKELGLHLKRYSNICHKQLILLQEARHNKWLFAHWDTDTFDQSTAFMSTKERKSFSSDPFAVLVCFDETLPLLFMIDHGETVLVCTHSDLISPSLYLQAKPCMYRNTSRAITNSICTCAKRSCDPIRFSVALELKIRKRLIKETLEIKLTMNALQSIILFKSQVRNYQLVDMQSTQVRRNMSHKHLTSPIEHCTVTLLAYDTKQTNEKSVLHVTGLALEYRCMACLVGLKDPYTFICSNKANKQKRDTLTKTTKALREVRDTVTTLLHYITDISVNTCLKIHKEVPVSVTDGDNLAVPLCSDVCFDSLSAETDKTSKQVSDEDDELTIALRPKMNDTFPEKKVTFKIASKITKRDEGDIVFNLKHKVEIQQKITQPITSKNLSKKNFNSKYNSKTESKNDYVDTIRDITWLPINEIPVPKIDIVVGRIEFEPLNTIIEQLARDENPGPHITMRYELLRFCTLRNYPRHDKPYLIRISGAGFYYAAEGDELVCYCCGMRKSGWTESDKPMEIHTRLSPRCSFLLRNEDVNVRVPEGRSEVDRFAFLNEPSSAQNTDVETTESNSGSSTIERVSLSELSNETQEDNMPPAGSQEFSHPIVNSLSFISERPQRRPGNFSYSSNTSTAEINNEAPQEDYMSPAVSQEFSRPTVSSSSTTPERPQRRHGNFSFSSNSSTAIATTTSQTTSAPTHAAGNRNPQPKHPNYAPRSVRVASFQGWPDDLTQTPEVLADAGFYYAGIADCVRCYFCGLGLRHWSEEDNPWIEHARWSRPCLYVKMIKGEEFINLVHLAVQYTENERTQNEEQQTTATASGETNTEHTGNQIPIDEINRLLLTDAAQSVLDMGYQPDMIKKAIEKVLIRDGRAGVSSTNIMAMIFEIEEDEVEAALTNRVNNIEISNDDNSSSNGNTIATNSTALENGTASTNTATMNNDTRHRNTVAARSTATGTANSSNDTASANSTTTNSMTGNQQSKTNTNKKDARTVKKENERMKMQTMCQICKNNSVAIVFLPCGHLVTCETCAPTLRNCPMQNCNTIVKGTVKAFMA